MSYEANSNAAGLYPVDANEQTFRKVTLHLVPFFCLCYFAAYLDRINVGLAKLQMVADLGFSETVYGLGAGLFFIGYIICEIPSNVIMQKMGARIWIARIMVTWGLLSGATMFVTTPTQFYVLRFLLGVAEAGFYPGVLLYLTQWFPSYKRSKIMASFLIGLPLASMLGSPVSGWILQFSAGLGGLKGWQWLFVLEAIPSVALGVIVLLYLPNTVEKAKWLSDDEKRALTQALRADTHGHTKHSMADAFRSGRVWLLGLIDMCLMMAIYAIGFWLPTIIRESGVQSPGEIGLLSAIPSAAAIVAMYLVGLRSDAMRERRWHIIVPMLVSAIGLSASTMFVHNTSATVLAFTIATAGVIAALPAFWCLPGTFLTGTAAAAGIALIASMANVGGFAATYLIGWLKDLTHSSTAGLLFFASFQLLGAVLVWTLPAKEVNR
jgi:MFS family permease